METVDVIIPIFGDYDTWCILQERAVMSVEAQTVQPQNITKVFGVDLCDARNTAAFESDADWLIFLDADDELDSHYIEEMLAGSGDIRQPSTLGIVNGVEDDYPVLIPKKSLIIGNYIVIGAMVRRELFVQVGGFRNFPIIEDWDCWLRMKLAGADIQPCPDAIYRVHVNEGSRNKQPPHLHGQVYSQIQREHEAEYLAKFGHT